MSQANDNKQEGGVPKMPNHPPMPDKKALDKKALEQSIKSHEQAKNTNQTVTKDEKGNR